MADNERTLPALPSLAALPAPVRQVALLVGLAASIAIGVAVVLWSQSTPMSALYTGLADRDAADIVALLDSTGVRYELDAATGSVLVPADSKYDVRMQLATAGLPRGEGFGVEQMPERTSFGQTPFMESALYAHAIENELARTISSLQPVEAARVHLALPPRSAFVRQRREPSASVMLRLYPGRRLDRGQIEAVVHLVASSVPELDPAKVTVVDQYGSLLTAPDSDAPVAMTRTQFEYRQALEQRYAQRIIDLLEPTVGAGRVRATVSADLDFTVTEETRESFDPETTVRSEQISEEQRTGELLAQGVPGALSNQPPQAEAQANGATPTSTSRSTVRNYEVGKTVSHTRQAVGAVERLSIAVLIDHRAGAEGGGEPLAEAEIASLTELAKQAVGFDEARGDSITVLNSPFQPPPEIVMPEPPGLLEQPWVLSALRQGLAAALVLALAFVIVRPIMRALMPPATPALPPGSPVEGTIVQAPGELPIGPPALSLGYDDRIAAARSLAGQDPRQIAQVVRSWVAEDNG